MKILILYGTTDGQTRKISRFVADYLVDIGHSIELIHVAESEDPDINLSRFDAALLAGSIHMGKFQSALSEFVKKNSVALNGMKTAFLSVSLSAAGSNESDWDGLRDCLSNFTEETGWNPDHVQHVAGALRFGEYDFFKSLAMRWIATKREAEVDTKQNKEYTDWEALKVFLDNWAVSIDT